jgi:hypothetical protein
MPVRRWILLIALLLSLSLPTIGQEDGLNLPTDLYTLRRDGRLERFGLGAAGMREVTPADSVPLDFGLSPDGIWLAFRTEAALSLFNMVKDETRLIDSGAGIPPYRGRGETIAWSPDGRALAYTVENGLRVHFFDGSSTDVPLTPLLNLTWSSDGRFLAAEAENDIWWFYAVSAESVTLRAALPGSHGGAWVSPSLFMLAPLEGGLAVMDLADGNRQTQLADASKLYANPSLRGDGVVAVFGRRSTDTSITPTAGYLHEITSTNAGVQITQVSEESLELNGLRWAPGGRLMTALNSGILALVDPATAQGFPLPMTDVVAYTWGAVRLPSVPNLPITAEVYFLADDGSGAQQVFALPEDGSSPVQVTFHPQSVERYAMLRDGRSAVYFSGDGLWLQQANTDEPRRLTDADGVTQMSLSADDTLLAYDTGEGVWALLLGSEEIQPTLLLEGYSAPQFVSALNGLLVRISDGDLGFVDLDTGEVRRIGTYGQAIPLPDGRILAVGSPTPADAKGLYVLDAFGAPPVLIYQPTAGLEIRDYAPLVNGLTRIVLTRIDGLPSPLRVFDVAPGQGPVGIPVLPHLAEARISPDGNTLMGYASGAGTLAIYNILLSAENVLTSPAPVILFSAQPFR